MPPLYKSDNKSDLYMDVRERTKADRLSPKAVFIDGTHIKANANTKKQVKIQIPAASKHYAKELMKDINADWETRGKNSFDDDDEPRFRQRNPEIIPPRRNLPGGKLRLGSHFGLPSLSLSKNFPAGEPRK